MKKKILAACAVVAALCAGICLSNGSNNAMLLMRSNNVEALALQERVCTGDSGYTGICKVLVGAVVPGKDCMVATEKDTKDCVSSELKDI